MRYCSVPQCNIYANSVEISFHKYPRDNKIQKIWLVKLRIGKTPKNFTHYAVCSKHFCASDFNAMPNGSKRRFLKDTAVLSINLPCRKFEKAPRPRREKHDKILSHGK